MCDFYGRQRQSAKWKLQSFFVLKAMTHAVMSIRDDVVGGAEPFDHYPDRPCDGKWYAMGDRYPADYNYDANPIAPYALSGEAVRSSCDCYGLKELTICEYDTAAFGKTHSGYHGCNFDDIPKMLYILVKERWELYKLCDKYNREVQRVAAEGCTDACSGGFPCD